MNKFITWFKKNIFEASYSEEVFYNTVPLMNSAFNGVHCGMPTFFIRPNTKNIFRNCYAINLFGIHIDFRCWYKYDDDPDNCYFFEEECQKYIKEVEKKNVRRKNKLPVPTYSRIPWYVTITNWRTLYYRSRSFIHIAIGFILGLIVKGLI